MEKGIEKKKKEFVKVVGWKGKQIEAWQLRIVEAGVGEIKRGYGDVRRENMLMDCSVRLPRRCRRIEENCSRKRNHKVSFV